MIIPPTPNALMNVLASDGAELDFKGVILLCAQWGIQPVMKYPADDGRPYYDWVETIRALARYTLDMK
jgi:hypothetical protein